MSTVSFALRAAYEGTVDLAGDTPDAESNVVPVFGGGVLAVGDRSFDVAEALDAGDGVITVPETDGLLVDHLSAYPALKRVDTPTGAEPVSTYKTMSLADLRGEAKRRGIEGAGSANKATLVDALTEYDERAADGDPTVNAGPDVNELTPDADTGEEN